jgi:anti-sigma regulatory factor (Ser/Thr protein kinase)
MTPTTLIHQTAHATRPAAPALRHSVTVPAELGELLEVRDALASALRRCGWNEEDAFRVLISTDEAFANALSHGSEGTGTIRTAFRVTSTAATVIVADRNRAGVATPALPAVPPESSEHGRGLILMRALADRMLVRGGPCGTAVALAFTIA